jgi:NTE family protein
MTDELVHSQSSGGASGTTAAPAQAPKLVDPIEGVDIEKEGLSDGIALCLSGGGSRAMLFHLGALWRLNDARLLGKLDRVSSVSGGSIMAGILAKAWSGLGFDDSGFAGGFGTQVVEKTREFANETIDVGALGRGVFLPGSAADQLVSALRHHLYGDTTLQDLPDRPRFVINATNLQSTVLWRFSKPYAGDYMVGRLDQPKIPLAVAVAASSAFPPFFSPVALKTEGSTFLPLDGETLTTPEYRERVLLADGGVYDNLGLETAYKRYRTLLVSDGGGKTKPDDSPATDWIQQPIRIMSIMDNQVRSLRKRMLINAYLTGERNGTFWGIRTNIADYRLEENGLEAPLLAPHEKTMVLAELPTRLAAVEERMQEALINWGYAVCDAGLRRHVDGSIRRPADFPYPSVGVG